MEIAYTEEQQALKSELRAYYENLLTPELELELSQAAGVGPTVRRVVKQMATDGWLGIGWPKEWGGQGRSAIEQFIFFDESMRSGAPVPMLTINTVGPTIMNFGIAGAKGVLPPEDPGGRHPFLHRLHRSQLGHRPGLPADAGRARWRGVRHQRRQDLHQLGRWRRLHLAGHADRSQRRQAQGNLACSSFPWTRPGSASFP